MKMTSDVARRCGEMLKSFADRKNLQANVEHCFGEGQTKVQFSNIRACREKVYHIIWDEVPNMSEACAYIYADLIRVWDLDKKFTCGENYTDDNTSKCDMVEEWQDIGFKIKDVIFNDPATIVLWEDGTKTVVKCQDGDVYSKETGLALCIAKKAMGNKGNFNEVFKKWIPEEELTTAATGTPTVNTQYNGLFNQKVLDKFYKFVTILIDLEEATSNERTSPANYYGCRGSE